MAKSLLGLEIGPTNISIAQLSGFKSKVVVEKLPENVIDNGEIVSPETLTSFIKETFKKNGFSTKKVALVLPESSTFFRTIDGPVISEAQLKLNLPYEFRDFTGLESNNFTYDYAVKSIVNDASGNPSEMHLIAAAARKSVVNQYATVLKNAGLQLSVAIPHEVSIINIAKNLKTTSKEVCLIGVSSSYSRVYVLKDDSIVASRTIDIGCNDIDAVISKKYAIDSYLASSYREANFQGCLESDECRAVYDALGLEVMKVINFYKYENSEAELNNCYFFSFGSTNNTLCQTVSSYLSIDASSITNILPDAFKSVTDAKKVLTAIGATL